jgi:starvation-inducible DNA-binding protein
MLDEHAGQVFAMTDVIAERARKLRGTTLHPIGDITRYERIEDNGETMVSPPQPAVSLKIRGGIPPCPKSSARCTAI